MSTLVDDVSVSETPPTSAAPPEIEAPTDASRFYVRADVFGVKVRDFGMPGGAGGPAGRLLARTLARRHVALVKDANVVELGAVSGLPGLFCAKRLGAKHVAFVTADVDHARAHRVEAGVNVVYHKTSANCCDWLAAVPDELAQRPVDVIVAANVLRTPFLAACFATALDAFAKASPGVRVIVGECHRGTRLDGEALGELGKAGWRRDPAANAHEDDVEEPPAPGVLVQVHEFRKVAAS